ncbi:DNA polymerase zeta processivity subunit [Zalerion maritima]|uniref:DNA polymerase zeta processivity subunit n=1 Tax=Zalerion maritima TaxID=339359 RepID=A0AAD5WY86_9PEZI|nr:DNA polymerase zeta processivity subunit [Zalerion maritima]
MAPPGSSRSVSLKSAITLLEHIQSFFLVSIHSLLHARALYPPTTFLTTRAFNLAVHQSRHPRVCSWVKDTVSSVCSQLATGTVHKAVFAIISQPSEEKGVRDTKVIERWVFDFSAFPVLPEDSWKETGNASTEFEEGEATAEIRHEEEAEEGRGIDEGDPKDDINWVDVAESLRGGLKRLQVAAETMDPIPEGCTFTVALELKEESPAPIGHPQPWIPTDPKHTPTLKNTIESGLQMKPIRSVGAGPLFFEIYMEEDRSSLAETE